MSKCIGEEIITLDHDSEFKLTFHATYYKLNSDNTYSMFVQDLDIGKIKI